MTKPKSKRPAPPMFIKTPAQAEPPPKLIRNHFVIVRDCSGSMQTHREGAERLFRAQIDLLNKTRDQKSNVTVYDFGRVHPKVQERTYNVPSAQFPPMIDWPAEGQTPLYDGVIAATKRVMADSDIDVAYVVIVLTDGCENDSYHSATALRDVLHEAIALGNWTFAFLLPPTAKEAFVRMSGVAEGNVTEWSNIGEAEREIKTSGSMFLAERTASRGLTRTSSNYFTTDLSKVTPATLDQLKDVTNDVRVFTVDKECDVKTFVNYKTGGNFQPGISFYEVMKKEKEVQDYKGLLMQDKTTKRIYSDDQSCAKTVRGVLGLPTRGTIALNPGNHANYTLYAQSMSSNRKLPRGTKVVVLKS